MVLINLTDKNLKKIFGQTKFKKSLFTLLDISKRKTKKRGKSNKRRKTNKRCKTNKRRKTNKK